MTDTKPEALRLADESDKDEWIAGTNQWREEAAAELRRLHEVNAKLIGALNVLMEWQVKNVRVWHNEAYDYAHDILAEATGESK
jgi:hypothetical protein